MTSKDIFIADTGQAAPQDPIGVPEDFKRYGPGNRAKARQIRKEREARQEGIPPSTFSQLIPRDYLNQLSQSNRFASAGPQTSLSPAAQLYVDHINDAYDAGIQDLGLLTYWDPDDLAIITSQGGELTSELMGRLEFEARSWSAGHAQDDRFLRLADANYRAAQERESLSREFHLFGIPISEIKLPFNIGRTDLTSEGPELEGAETVGEYTFRPEDYKAAVLALLEPEVTTEEQLRGGEFAMYGMGKGFNAFGYVFGGEFMEDFGGWERAGGEGANELIPYAGTTLAAGTVSGLFQGLLNWANFGVDYAQSVFFQNPAYMYRGMAQLVGPDLAERWWGYTVAPSAELLAQAERLAHKTSDAGRREVRGRIQSHILPELALQETIENDPELWQHYVDTHGVEFAAAGFHRDFALFAQDKPLLSDEQLEDLENAMLEPEINLYNSLEDANFSTAHTILQGLSSYGRWTESNAAGALTFILGMTDEDNRNLVKELKMEQFYENMALDMEEGNQTPAGVLGLDGTAFGLLTNIVGGFLFDPTTYLGMGAFKSAVAVGTTTKSVQAIMKLPSMQIFMREIARFGPDVTRTATAKAAMFSSFGDVGMIDDAYAMVGLADQVIPQGGYLHSPLGRHSHVVDLQFVDDLLDPTTQAKIAEKTGKVDNLTASLRTKGFDEPLILELDLKTEQLYLADGGGVKRIAAIKQIEGATKVPVVVRIRPAADSRPPSLSQQGVALKSLKGHLPRGSAGEPIGKSRYVNPLTMFSMDQLGTVANRALIATTVEKALLRGAVFPAAHQTWLARGLGYAMNELGGTPLGRRLQQPFVRFPSVTEFAATGPGAATRMNQITNFLGATHPEWANLWTQRIMQNHKMVGRRNVLKMQGEKKLQWLYRMEDDLNQRAMAGSPYDPGIVRRVGDKALRTARNIDEARTAIRELVDIMLVQNRRTLNDASAEIVSWQTIWDDIYSDFLKNNMHESWRGTGLVKTDGSINWNLLRRGSPDVQGTALSKGEAVYERRLAAQVAAEKQGVGFDASLNITTSGDELLRMFQGGIGDDAIHLPVTPIELLAATRWGGSKYTRWSQEANKDFVRQTLFKLDATWTAMVLLVPRVLAVMSIDELHSLLHSNIPDFGRRYLHMRADKLQARLDSVIARDGNVGLSGTGRILGNVDEGAMNMPASVRERLRNLEDMPSQVRNYAEKLMENQRRELVTMEYGELGYREAAQAYAQAYLRNPAFRAFHRGQEGFQKWFVTPEGQEWRLSQSIKVVEKAADGRTYEITRPILDSHEGYAIANQAWDYLISQARKSGLEGDALVRFGESWKNVAKKYDGDASGRIYALDPWTFQYLGPIRGLKATYPGPSLLWKSVAQGFQKGAADPAATRQALAAEMVREAEIVRLTKLFEDQGLTLVSDLEVLGLLRTRGIDVDIVNPFTSPGLDMMLIEDGIVTQSYIARLAENRAQDFATKMTYSSDVGSAGGRKARAVWRFGQAYGDMFGRWGRILGSRMITRPWLDRIGMRNLVQKAADMIPLNPKTMASLSRWSNQDLKITGGFAGESQTDLDFSPITFLPNITGGLHMMIPGFAPWMISGIDQLVDAVTDPVNDPQGYTDLIDNLSQLIPSMHFHGRQPWTRYTGSGNAGFLFNLASATGSALFKNPNFDQLRGFTGDVKTELLASRQVNVVFSDESIWEDLFAVNDPELVELIMLSGLADAEGRAGSAALTQTVVTWGIPVAGATDTSLDELYHPWVKIVRDNPGMFVVRMPTDSELQADRELLRSVGNDIRTQFYKLETWQRDLIIAKAPWLTPNLVQTWQWNPNAPADLPGRNIGYRTVGSSPDDTTLSEQLERHDMYVGRGWVVPRDRMLKPHDFVGTAINARQNITEHLYTMTAEVMNDIRWEAFVTPETKTMLDVMVDDPRLQDLGVEDGRQLWEMWGSEREKIREAVALRLGLDYKDEDTKAVIDDILKVPAAEEAWSTNWKGNNLDNWSEDRVLDAPTFFTPEALHIASELGFDTEEGMTGRDFLEQLIEYRFSTQAAWNAVYVNYSNWQQTRSIGYQSSIRALQELIPDPHMEQEYRDEVAGFVEWVEFQSERFDAKDLTRAVQDEAVDRFMRLATAGHNAPVNWDDVWHGGFSQRFGPLNWQPPTPVSPFDGAGNPISDAWQPYIRSVVDGDTLHVSEHRGPSLTEGLFGRLEPTTGGARYHSVRLLGIMAPEMNSAEGPAAKRKLEQALADARRSGAKIWLVRDPNYARSNVDPFGRELAWLWIGDTPYYEPDTLRRGE